MIKTLRPLLFIVLSISFVELRAQQIVLPIEVLGEQYKVESRSFDLTQEQADEAQMLWMQVNNLSYEDKGSIKINNGSWITLNHETVDMQYQEKARGGMVHGGFSTIRFSVPVTGFTAGSNTISFRFNLSDGISIGYRVVDFNLLNDSKTQLLDQSMFEEEDPSDWLAPEGFQDASSIAEGKTLWETAPLWSNYLDQDTLGAWYGETLQPAMPINATCNDCHVSNGFDLEYFSYSNESIIERSKFHNLSEDEGKKISAYIRSLSSEPDGPQRHGRPWNPPYQPGPNLDGKSIDHWAAGAGLDAVLDKDADMIEYMFPNGMDSESINEYFDSDKVEDHTLMPVAVQMPDWKHWLPIVHPKDAFTINDYYENPTVDIHPKIGLEQMENFLNNMPAENWDAAALQAELRRFHKHFRHFWDQTEGEKRHWRSAGDALRNNTYNEAVAHIPDGIPVELTVTSLARLLAVKNFEIMNLYNLQDKAEEFVIPEDVDELTDRRWQWVGVDYNIFEIPPHFTSCASDGNCDRFIGQPVTTGFYESTAWYQLQLVLNGGNGNLGGNEPMDWQYQLQFILKASHESKIYEPMRYYHSLNAMYQLRTWDKENTPNNGKGFRARQQFPHWFFGMSDSNNFHGFSPDEFPAMLDGIQPGLQKKILDALLQQFLDEVNRPEMSLSTWAREGPHGGEYELEPADKNDALVNVENKIGLFYYTDKMYYLLPKFAAMGVDCQIIDELVDWSAEAWPNYDWEQFRSLPQATVQIANEAQIGCGESTITLIAAVGNEGDNPTYEWAVNGSIQGGNESSFSSDQLVAGDLVSVELTSNSTCTTNLTASASYTVIDTGFKTWTNKNNEGWSTSETVEVCNDDEVAVKIDITSEPLLWLDAYEIGAGAQPQNGDLISSWLDRSGNNYDVSTTNSALYPSFNPTGMNGKPAVMFGMNNNADGLRLFNTSDDDFMEDDWSVILVGEVLDGATNWVDVIGNKTESSSDDGWFIRYSKEGYSQVSAGGAYHQDNNSSLPLEFISILQKKGRDITFILNGEVIEEFTMQEGEKITTNFEMFLGLADKGNAGTSRYHHGPISELMFFDYAINEQETEYLEGYLGHKWGLMEELPQFHAYKQVSPLDVTVSLPDGTEAQLNGANREYSYQINKENEGPVEFVQNAFSCPDPQHTSTFEYAEDMDAVAIQIEYSLDGSAYLASETVLARSGQSLDFRPDVIVGTRQWEKPDGSLLDLDVDPSIASIANDENIGVWTAHIDYGGCYIGNGRDIDFEVTYDPGVYYDITVNVSANGTSDVIGDISVGESTTLAMLLTPDAGYKLGSVEVDNVPQSIEANYGDPVTYELEDIMSDHIIDVNFIPLEIYSISINVNGNGTSDPIGSNDVYENDDLSILLTPDDGFKLISIDVDGVPQSIDANYGDPVNFDLTEIASDHTVDVSFGAIPEYTISVNITGSGISDPTGSIVVEENDDLSLLLTPDSDHKLVSIELDGVLQTIEDNYGDPVIFDLTEIASDHTVDVTFEALENFTVAVNITGNGTSNPVGPISIQENSDLVITVTPDAGNRIVSILLDGVDQNIEPNNGEAVNIDLSPVLSDHEVNVTFEEIYYDITASSGSNGTISPDGTTSYKHGANATYQFSPSNGYRIKDVTVDGVSAGSGSSYEFLNLTSDHTISVNFEKIPVFFTLNASAGDNGSITPEGNIEVLEGTDQNFIIQPDEGYLIEDVIIDNESVGAVESFLFEDVSSDHTIVASFVENIPPLSIDDVISESKIYPNPSSGEFHLEMEKKIVFVKVLSIDGRQINEVQKLGNNHYNIDHSNLKVGFYVVQVFLEDNSMETFKLLLSK
ncbi:MAG: T9SS type A sorting domain-containing protein [Reichenbachiella sp.]